MLDPSAKYEQIRKKALELIAGLHPNPVSADSRRNNDRAMTAHRDAVLKSIRFERPDYIP